MPDNFRDMVYLWLRDRQGYTGDGYGGNGLLPVGDMSTAERPISKRDLRELFLTFENSAEQAGPILAAAGPIAIAANRIAADANIEVTVGSGGQYSTINAALAALSTRVSRQYRSTGVTATIRLRPGFVLNEQVFARDGIDLGWITIISDDAVVPINPAALTTFLVENENSRPAFGATRNSVLPNIGVQFQFQPGGAQSQHGLEVYWNSSCQLLPGSGFRNSPGRALSALYGSLLYCYPDRLTSSGVDDEPTANRGIDCSNAQTRGLYVAFGSRAFLACSNFDNCAASSNAAVYVIWNSMADIYRSYVRNSGAVGVQVRDMSLCNARECEVNGAATFGFHALHQGHINARWLNTIGTQGASGCQIGVLCNHGSTIEAVGLPARNCTVVGVSAARNSRVSAESMDVAGSTIGFLASQGSTISAAESIATNCSDAGYRAASGSTISATSGNANGCGRGVETVTGGKVFIQSGTATGCTQRALSALEGGEINGMSGTWTGAGVEGVTARNGSRVNIQNANARRGGADQTSDITIQTGSTINAGGATGGTNVTVNAVTAAGIIFR